MSPDALGDEPVDLPPQRDADPELGLVASHPQPRPQQVAERPVRDRPSVAHASALEPERPAVLRRHRPERTAQLVHHAGLADAGLAGDEHDAARVPARPRRPRRVALASSRSLPTMRVDDPAIGPRRARRRRARHGERGHRLGLTLELERLARRPT